MEQQQLVLFLIVITLACIEVTYADPGKHRWSHYRNDNSYSGFNCGWVNHDFHKPSHRNNDSSVRLGPRPFYLVSNMDESDLKEELQECSRSIQKNRLFNRPSWRSNAISRAYQRILRNRSSHGRRHFGM